MTRQLYRIRPIRHLLGKHQELREQQIFFARPDDLNDPMEGFRDIVWKGDAVVWTNLFRNYISTLYLTVFMVRLTGDTESIIPVFLPIEDLDSETRTPMEARILDEICSRVFERCRLQTLIQNLERIEHAVRQDELSFYLKTIHYVALEEIHSAQIRHRLISVERIGRAQVNPPEYLARLPDLVHQAYAENPNLPPTAASTMFSISNRLFDNQNILRKLDARKQRSNTSSVFQSNWDFILLDFPREYVSQLPRILYPEWYVACFLEDYRNSSLWGHYGENHRGACLIFDVDDVPQQACIQLKRIIGISGQRNENTGDVVSKPTWEYSPVLVHNVSYQTEIEELDFFRSIGALTTGQLVARWYTDPSGKRSKSGDHIGSDDFEAWRKAHWDKFYRDITIKTKDWAYEKEVRLILASGFMDLSEPSARALTYRFSSLRGIIFGISMCDEDKVEAINIILDKCRETSRDSFEFYQAYFNHETKGVEAERLQIKVNPG